MASPRAPVITAIKAVEAAGLTVVRVDLASFAVLRSSADGQLGVEVVIDLGAHLTTIVVHQHGVPRLVRTLARGGDELTARLAERLEIDLVAAEAVKCSQGLDTTGDISPILRELVAPLLAEIRSSVNYFRIRPSRGPDRPGLAHRACGRAESVSPRRSPPSSTYPRTP